MKTRMTYLHFCILMIITTSLGFAAGTSIPGVTSFSVYQLDLMYYNDGAMNSSVGLMTGAFTPGATPVYINIFASQTSNPNDAKWVARNLFLPDNSYNATDQTLSARFDLSLVGFPAGDVTSIYIYMNASNSIVQDFSLTGVEIFMQYEVGSLTEDTNDDITTAASAVPALETDSAFPDFSSQGNFSNIVYRGCDVPNIDLDNSTHAANMPQYAGDVNACAPASATNSLLWLAQKHAEIILPEAANDERELIEALSEKMKRLANSGVLIEDFLRGKLDFINDHQLDINVKFQSESVISDIISTDGLTLADNQNGGASFPTWAWLKQQMDSGEDVEMCYYWWDGESWRGHAVVVTGAADNGEGNLKTIYYKHDHDQSNTGGTTQESSHIMVDADGRMRICQPDPDDQNRPPYVAHVIAESPGDPYVTPVELGFFTANVQKNTICLTWRTESETNNYGFDLIRDHKKIAFIKGNGTTVEPKDYSYVDAELSNGFFQYELVQIDIDGTRKSVGCISANVIYRPTMYALQQNYPNPFNNATKISYSIPEKSLVTLKVYSLLGEEVAVLVNQQKEAGHYIVEFNARNIVSGVYFYRIEANGYKEMRKIILLK